jgi:uncharacterized Zn-binding protein involved in type VI secretion
MSQTIIYVGCKSDHGGVVLTGDPLATVCGVPMSRIGDLHACPQFYPGPSPHGVTAIVRGPCSQDRGTVNRREFAVSTDRTGCGASLLPCPGCAEAVNAC